MSVLQPIESPADVVVEATNVTKIYGKGEAAVHALRGVDVQIGRGEFTAIMGPSGSGKSTLMHCLAGLDSITDGTITLDDVTVSKLSERKLTRLRRDKIGFIFQSFNLIPTLNAEENIKLPADIAKRPISRERFNTLVQAVGIADRLKHRPAELSGGQQQRVACARALATDPTVVFADEPTGNLDSKSTRQILSFLRHAVDSLGQTVVMVTHEPDAAAFADRVLFLFDGQVVAQLRNPQRDTILDALRELGGPDSIDSFDEDGSVLADSGARARQPQVTGVPTRSSREIRPSSEELAASGMAGAAQQSSAGQEYPVAAEYAAGQDTATASQGTAGAHLTDPSSADLRTTSAAHTSSAPHADATTHATASALPTDGETGPTTPTRARHRALQTPTQSQPEAAQSTAPQTPEAAASPTCRTPSYHTPGDQMPTTAASGSGRPATPTVDATLPADATPDAPLPGEPLDVALRRMAPARDLEPETERVLEAAQRVLQNLPGSVIPQDDPSLTGQIPIVPDTSKRSR